MDMILRVFGVIRVRRLLLFVTFGVVFTAVITGSYIRKPTYESNALLLVKLDQRSVSISRSDVQYSVAHTMAVEVITSQAEILGSQTLIEGVVNELGPETFNPTPLPSEYKIVELLKGAIKSTKNGFNSILVALGLKFEIDPHYTLVKRVRRNLKIFAVRKAQIIELSFRDKNPEIPKKVLDTLIKLYIEQTQAMKEQSESYRFYSGQTKELKKKLAQAERDFSDFQIKYSIVDLGEEKRSIQEKRNKLVVMLGDSNPISDADDSLNSMGAGAISSIIDPQTKKFKAQLIGLKTERSKLLITYSKSHQKIKAIDSQIDLLEKYLKEEKEALTVRAAAYNKRLALLTKIEPEYNNLSRDVTSWQEAYNVYGKVSEDRNLARKQPSGINLRIVDPPIVPFEPLAPSRLMLITIGFLFSWMFALGTIIFVEFFWTVADKTTRERDSKSENPDTSEGAGSTDVAVKPSGIEPVDSK